MGVYGPWEVAHLFSREIPVECRQNHVWGPIFDPSYDHIYKNVYFEKSVTNYTEWCSQSTKRLDFG